MAAQLLYANPSIILNSSLVSTNSETMIRFSQFQFQPSFLNKVRQMKERKLSIFCSEKQIQIMRTCKNCKTQYDPLLNHPRACSFHTAHFGGETKRKFESVHSGGTLDTPDSGKVFQYWHCCGSEDPFDLGCTAAPHASYDD